MMRFVFLMLCISVFGLAPQDLQAQNNETLVLNGVIVKGACCVGRKVRVENNAELIWAYIGETMGCVDDLGRFSSGKNIVISYDAAQQILTLGLTKPAQRDFGLFLENANGISQKLSATELKKSADNIVKYKLKQDIASGSVLLVKTLGGEIIGQFPF